MPVCRTVASIRKDSSVRLGRRNAVCPDVAQSPDGRPGQGTGEAGAVNSSTQRHSHGNVCRSVARDRGHEPVEDELRCEGRVGGGAEGPVPGARDLIGVDSEDGSRRNGPDSSKERVGPVVDPTGANEVAHPSGIDGTRPGLETQDALDLGCEQETRALGEAIERSHAQPIAAHDELLRSLVPEDGRPDALEFLEAPFPVLFVGRQKQCGVGEIVDAVPFPPKTRRVAPGRG